MLVMASPVRWSGARSGVIALLCAFAGGGGGSALAATWSVEVAPAYVTVEGHDPDVLAVRRGGMAESVALATDDALGYRAGVLWDRGAWSYGLDFFIHRTDQSAGPLQAGGASLELPHRSFTAAGPGQDLYFRTLEDTTVELWVLDLTARRRLGGGSPTLIFGLRNADFDNDYRAIAGLGDVGGTRLDASSNYSRMMGPLVGIAGAMERGRHRLGVDLRASVVFGDIELSRALRDFSGPPGAFAGPPEEVPATPEEHVIARTDSIEVPMADLRLWWEIRLGSSWAIGASAGGTAWFDLAVPPGVDPSRPDALEETTLVPYDIAATVRWTF